MAVDLEKLIIDVFAPKAGERVFLLNDFPADIAEIDRVRKDAFNPLPVENLVFPGNYGAVREDYSQRWEMANQWHAMLTNLAATRGFTVNPIITYEPTGGNGRALPNEATMSGQIINLPEIMESWGSHDIVIAIARYSPTKPIFELIENGQKFRGATMPGARMDMPGFEADYNAVGPRARILARELTKATYALVKFSTGDRMLFDLRGGRKGHADDGQCTKPGQKINLPSGEAYKAPYEGLDLRLGQSMTNGTIPVMYGDEMVVYHVEGGRIVEVLGRGPKARERSEFFKVDPARGYIAEFAGGCNDKALLCGSTLNDEKLLGWHWAYGANDHLGGAIGMAQFQNAANVVHDDFIYAANSPVQVEELRLGNRLREWVIMQNGLYLPEVLGDKFRL